MKTLVAVMLATLSLATTGKPQSTTGNELYEACAATDNARQGFCIGYILGQIEGQSFGAFAVVNQLAPADEASEVNEKIGFFLNYCTPVEATNRQLIDVVVSWLEQLPAERHNPARFLVWQAFMDAFPCDNER